MSIFKKGLCLSFFLIYLPTATYALGTGTSVSPLAVGSNVFSAEGSGITSDDGGIGVQARYTRKMSELLSFEAGVGMGGGDRSSRVFVGADYEFLPDYGRQPKFSMKTQLSNYKAFGRRRTSFNIAPVLAKGFSFWGHAAYPYLSVPAGIILDQTGKNYRTTLAVSPGIIGPIPGIKAKGVKASVEGLINIKGGYSGVIAGLHFAL